MEVAARPPVPFVVGVTRSGTTLLRLMLDAHPELTIPPESGFIPDVLAASSSAGVRADDLVEAVVSNRRWGDFGLDPDELATRVRALDPVDAGDAIRAVYDLYAQQQGKPRWGDKTPGYVDHMSLIESVLPEARFVHLIRDGRDAALSRAAQTLKRPAPAAKAAKRWKRRILGARRQAAQLGHYLEVRYDDLVLDTEAVLRTICDFVDLPFDDAMLAYHERAADRLQEMARDLPERPGKRRRPADHRLAVHALTSSPPDPSRLARWRTEMSVADQEAFRLVAGDLLESLGYDPGPVDPAGPGPGAGG